MNSLKAGLLASSAFSVEESDTDTGTAQVATPCLGVAAVEPDTGATARLPTSVAPRAPNSPRAPPWGVLRPAVERLEPIGLSPLQAAAFLGTSRSRIYRLLREGRLHALKQGTATIVTMTSLRSYAANLPAATFGRGEEVVQPPAR
jgi:excisionase family DNA binding protein